jgi:hypothetical protein
VTDLHPDTLDRMVRAVEKVRERLLRATAALDDAGVPYAVTGGNAVATWVAQVDEAAVRNTQDVDVLVSRADFEQLKMALEAAGFVHRRAGNIDMFLDGPGAKARDAVRVLFAGEKVRPEYVLPTASVAESERSEYYRVVSLDALLRMELTAFRAESGMHVRDLIDVGLVDESWLDRVSPLLRDRLQQLLDDPDG